MPLTASATSSFSVALPDEHATRRLAIDIANSLEGGDFVTLSGDLGAGKTTLVRTLIRYLAGDAAIEVPSPTFTLMQIYELPQFPLVHADLYRLSGPAELAELGFDDLPEGAVVLLEWPDRADGLLPPDRLDVSLTLAPKLKLEFRHARMTGYGAWAPRVDRMAAVRQFIAESGYSEALRVRLRGDASTRSYERLALGDQRVLLMNSPRRPDGPPVRGDKPYSAIAHLADNVVPFVAMANGLRRVGLSAPAVHHADLEHGFLMLEDLGDEGVVSGDPPAPMVERYEAAVDVLLALHTQQLPDTLPVAPQLDYRIPPYDMNAFLIEAELLLDWFLPRLDAAIPDTERGSFRALWRELLAPIIDAPPTWVLRDFHSPNLLWLPQRSELARLGLRSRLAVAGCTRGRRRRDRARAARPLRARTQPQRGGLQRRGVHQDLRHARRPAREQDPRHLRPPRPARRQAPISAPPAAGVGLFAALAQPPGAGGAQRVVYCPRAGVEYDLIQRALGMAILPAEFAQAPICS